MQQIYDMGQTALLPLRRKVCCGFFPRQLRRLQPGLNPRTWVPEASMLTTRPLKPLPGSSVGIATGYRLDGPRIKFQWGARISAPVQTGPGAHPASCTIKVHSVMCLFRYEYGVFHPRRDDVTFYKYVLIYPTETALQI
jgi:hypothetical protein